MLTLVGEEALQTFVTAINASTVWLGISWDPSLEVGVVLRLKACFDFGIVKTEVCLDLVTKTPEGGCKHISYMKTCQKESTYASNGWFEQLLTKVVGMFDKSGSRSPPDSSSFGDAFNEPSISDSDTPLKSNDCSMLSCCEDAIVTTLDRFEVYSHVRVTDRVVSRPVVD